MPPKSKQKQGEGSTPNPNDAGGSNSQPKPKRQPPPKDDRDPKKLNTHLKLEFLDSFGEPYRARSFDMVWQFSTFTYECFRDLTYCLASTFCGIFIALAWGCQFGQLAFYHIWILSPRLQSISITCKALRRFVRLIARCCFYPYTRACSYFFVVFKSDNVDFDAIDNPPINHPVRKIKIIPEKPNPVVQGTSTPDTGVRRADLYLGDKEKMRRSVNRQLLL